MDIKLTPFHYRSKERSSLALSSKCVVVEKHSEAATILPLLPPSTTIYPRMATFLRANPTNVTSTLDTPQNYRNRQEPLTIWGYYWKHAKAYDANLENDWKDDLDTLLVVVSYSI